MKLLAKDIYRLVKKCKAVGESPVYVALRHTINRLLKKKNVMCSSDVCIKGMGNIQTNGNLLLIGMSYNGLMCKGDRTNVSIEGKLIINGAFSIGKGCRIDVAPNAIVSLEGGYINALSKICIGHHLTIGKNCAISWDTLFLDRDFHYLVKEEHAMKADGIEIGDNCWVGNNVSLTRGARVPNDTIIASNSLVNREFSETNTLIGGIPARVLRRNVSWE